MSPNLTALLLAISLVESGGNDLASGKAGEVSRYQITPLVWKAYAQRGESPICASDAAKVATRFIEAEILPALRRAGKPITPANIAACWNYGPKAAIQPWPDSVRNYTIRVNALYEQSQQR